MIAEMSTKRATLAVDTNGGSGLSAADQLAEKIREQWNSGETPDVNAALADHPQLRSHRTIVLELAYREYAHRLQAGEGMNAETFSRRFPSFQKSLQMFITLRHLLSQNPDFQAFQDISSWPEPGDRFLQYDLIAEIGRGSFGRVFLATEPDLGGRKVVVKVAPQGGEEAKILGRLRHDNIVPIHSLQKDASGLTAFCMPYLGRATLCDVLDYAFLDPQPPERASFILDAVEDANDEDDDFDSSEFPHPAPILRRGSYVDGVIHLAGQLADALAHSHGRGICHRDLKPSNVLITPDGQPLLLDFNLSVDQRMVEAKIGGTLPYMAPEELAVLFEETLEPGCQRYDPRSDLFSLGVIIYELLTGKLPFGLLPSSPTLEKLAFDLHERQKDGPESIREFNNRVDPKLARLVESCLAFEPDRRPETAHQLATALRGQITTYRRSRRWMGNHRKLVTGATATVLALFVAITLFFALRPPYSERQLQLGIECIEEGQYAIAVNHLNNAILDNPTSTEALFARGHAYQRSNEYYKAYQDYDLSYKLLPTPLLNACRGYCLSQVGSHKAAIAAYQLALHDGCDSPAFLYNNIGYSYLMLRQLDQAEKYLQLAIRSDGKLQAPHFNLMKVFLRRAFQGRPIPSEAFAHVIKAIEIGPPSGDLYRIVAVLFARASSDDPSLVQPAIDYVKKAIENGIHPKSFASDPSFASFIKEPAFQELLKTREATTNFPQEAIQLLDPLPAP